MFKPNKKQIENENEFDNDEIGKLIDANNFSSNEKINEQKILKDLKKIMTDARESILI